jgi:hypothetical protein
VKPSAAPVDQLTMLFLFPSGRAKWSRVAMDASGFAFALSLIAIVAQSS